MLTDALIRAERRGQPNILGFLRELPGEQASIDLSRVAEVANQVQEPILRKGVALARSAEAASTNAGLRATRCVPAGPVRWFRFPCPTARNPCGF